MAYAYVFGFGLLVGFIITCLIFRGLLVGSLRVDNSDPDEEPYLFLELHKGVNEISNKKYVLLKVNVKNFLTQK
jgi:hypothetical protein